MRRFAVALLCGAALILSRCSPTGPAAQTSSARLSVVATFSILGDLVQNVGKDKIELKTLVGPDSDTHTYEPKPSDGVALVEAQVVFENGLGFETWFDKLLTSSGSRATRVVVTQGILPGKITVGEDTGQTDPHAWQDVGNVMRMVGIIRDALIQSDPANASAYTANAEAYLASLSDLDHRIASAINTLPLARRKLVTSHDALGYFARRYGLEIVGTAIPSGSTDAAEPSAGELADLIDQIKSEQVPAVFFENITNPSLMAQIARDAGVTLGPALYTDALGTPGSEGDTYLKMMEYNATAIVAALGE